MTRALHASGVDNGLLVRDQADGTGDVTDRYDSHHLGGPMLNVGTQPQPVVSGG